MKTLLLILSLSVFLFSCGGTTTGNPLSEPVNVRMVDQQPFALLKRSWDLLFIPEAHAAATQVKFCFKRLRFKPDSSTSGSNYDLTLGEIELDPAGTNLVTVNVPRGIYGRIEFDLENECDGTPGKPSVSFVNGVTTYSTQDHITIKFEGTFEVSAASTVTLDVDLLLDALDGVTNDGDIKTSLEAVTGDF